MRGVPLGWHAHAPFAVGRNRVGRVVIVFALGIEQLAKRAGLVERTHGVQIGMETRRLEHHVMPATGLHGVEQLRRLIQRPEDGRHGAGHVFAVAQDFQAVASVAGCIRGHEHRFNLVVFDQQLRPALRDESGKAVKDLPKPSGSDDRELAARALARWKALKKDVKTLAQGQLLRLELAMASRRRWPASDWSQFLLQHPLLVHLVRGLLWGIYSPDGRLLTCFRVAEDSSLAGLDDTPLELDSPGMVGLPHPLELTAEQLASWSDLFSDYQILQPFPQLGRPTYRLTQQELAGTELTRQRGRVVHPGKIANLESRGWRRGETWDGGVCAEMLRPMGEGRWAHLEFRDGLYLGALHESGDQTLDKVVVKQGSQALVLGDLDEILVSELLADLEGVR